MKEVREDKKEIKNAVWTFTNNETKRYSENQADWIKQKSRQSGANEFNQ